jgi:hypothetical protein
MMLVTEDMIDRFIAALRPGRIVWYNGRLSVEEERIQAKRAILAALGECPR